MISVVDQNEKIEQARNISNVGCIGVAILLVILVLIGAGIIRADISKKRGDVLAARGRIYEQLVKAPGVLSRMNAYDCGTEAENAVSDAESSIGGLSDGSSLADLEASWEVVEDAWAAINAGCRSDLDDPAFLDLTTEITGLRDRIAVEKGKYRNAAEIYNSARNAFPANLVSFGFEDL